MSVAKPDVALVPVSGTYVMIAEEAGRHGERKDKVKEKGNPDVQGLLVGNEQDAAKFKWVIFSPVPKRE